MGLFSKSVASAADSTARAAYAVGTKVAGETGGKVADAISNKVIAPVRSRIDESCTCGTDCNH